MARRSGYYKAEFPPLIPQDVKRPIYGQGGPHLAQRQSEMGDGDGDTRPHPGQDRVSPHQADHSRRLSNRPGEKRIQRFDGRDVQDNAPGWRPLHRQQHPLLPILSITLRSVFTFTKCRHGVT